MFLLGLVRIGGSEDYRELVVVDPPFGPIDLWLGCRKPWIAEDHLLGAQFGKEEPHLGSLLSSPDFEVREEFNLAVFVGGSVHVVDLPWRPELLKGDP